LGMGVEKETWTCPAAGPSKPRAAPPNRATCPTKVSPHHKLEQLAETWEGVPIPLRTHGEPFVCRDLALHRRSNFGTSGNRLWPEPTDLTPCPGTLGARIEAWRTGTNGPRANADSILRLYKNEKLIYRSQRDNVPVAASSRAPSGSLEVKSVGSGQRTVSRFIALCQGPNPGKAHQRRPPSGS